MTEEHFAAHDGTFKQSIPSAIFPATRFTGASHHPGNSKRTVTYRCCSNLAASNLPGSGWAVEYIYTKYIKNLSAHTIQGSGRVVLFFLRFLARRGTDISLLTRQDINAYVEYNQERGLKPQSVVHHLRSVYAFTAYLVEQNILPFEVMQHKIRIKLPDKLPRAIPPEDIEQLLEAITTVRDRALILLLLRTGMRIGELLAVTVHDISFVERKILIYQGEKNYQGRAVYYSEDAEEALQQWLMERRKSDSTNLFPGNAGRSSISYVTAWGAMRELLKRARLTDKGYSLHSLRHTFATDMLNAGMRLEVLQQLLGHQEIEMTMRYARITDRTREHEYFTAMEHIEQGNHHEPHRINTQLRKVFEEKKLFQTHRKKLS